MTDNDLNGTISSLRSLPPGKSMVYYTGDLARDRAFGRDAAAVDLIGKTAWELANGDNVPKLRARVTLTQRRTRHGDYEYVATGLKALQLTQR